MSHRALSCFAFTLALLVAHLPGIAAAQEPPRWKFEEGQRFAAMLDRRAEHSATEEDRTIILSRSYFTLYFNCVVDSVDENGVATITPSLQRYVYGFEIQFDNGKYHFDSAEQNPEGGSEPRRELSFQIKLDPRGQVVGSEFPEELEGAAEGMNQLAEAYVGCSMAGLLSESLFVLPEEGIAVDESAAWQIEDGQPVPEYWGECTRTQETDASGNELAIFQYELEARKEFPAISPPFSQGNTCDSATVRGTVTFDCTAGYLTQNATVTELRLSQDDDGDTIHSLWSIETKFTLEPLEEE